MAEALPPGVGPARDAYARLAARVAALTDAAGFLVTGLCAAPAGGAGAHQLPMDSKLSHFLGSYYALLDRRAEQSLDVAVLALTKSGAFPGAAGAPGAPWCQARGSWR